MDKTVAVGELAQRYREESRRTLRRPPLRQALEAQRLAKALLSISSESCSYITKSATELALKLIGRPYGMTQDDRLWLNHLLSHGLDPDSRDGTGKTLLMAACYAGDLETVISLRDRGARKDATDIYGKTAEGWAAMNGDDETRPRALHLLSHEWAIPAEALRGPKPNEFALRSEIPREPQPKTPP